MQGSGRGEGPSAADGRSASEPSDEHRAKHSNRESPEGDNMGRKWLQVSAATHDALKDMSRSTGRSIEVVIGDLVDQRAKAGRQFAKRPRATYEPMDAYREAPVVVDEAALLFIDVQNYNCHRDGALYCGKPDAEENQYFWQKLGHAKPKLKAMRDLCKKAGIEVMYTVIEALTPDCRDMSMDYKISGFKVPPGCFDAQVLDCIAPADGDIVLPKTSCSVFSSTQIDRILQNLNVRFLIVAGCLTDQCVESAVREACDKNYNVTLLSDGCITKSEERHEDSLRAIRGFCRQRTCQQLSAEIQGILSHKSC